MEKYGGIPPGYTGTCGLFCGDGTLASGVGCRCAGNQRSGRGTGTYADAVAAAEAVWDPCFSFHK